MHKITRTLVDGDTQSRTFHDEPDAERCFDSLTCRADVRRIVWHEGDEWDVDAKRGG